MIELERGVLSRLLSALRSSVPSLQAQLFPEAIANLGEHGSPELYELAARQAKDLTASAAFFAAGKRLDEQWTEWEAAQQAAAVEIGNLYVDCLIE